MTFDSLMRGATTVHCLGVEEVEVCSALRLGSPEVYFIDWPTCHPTHDVLPLRSHGSRSGGLAMARRRPLWPVPLLHGAQRIKSVHCAVKTIVEASRLLAELVLRLVDFKKDQTVEHEISAMQPALNQATWARARVRARARTQARN
eukprot:CAMPEP_0119406562 /NCGR_PEP_ID=MMETSP1335-20130426/843_1 /TAXON_ID=259385 /ORGANISM="Chrysoculter rhomboideus, Strain RCC1486" /LENGTH=145 /DNA_ID=CAMNT_0007430645 /DNA_START=68 /DNA_END=503 /DNA_ORIENTATION=+